MVKLGLTIGDRGKLISQLLSKLAIIAASITE
jgi:hypothetical protein